MTPPHPFIGLALFLAIACTPALVRAAEEPAAAAGISQTPFTLLIVGTRHHSDVEVMIRNVGRISKMQRLVQTVASQNHLQFTGLYGGEVDGLVADIQGLAADRFEVQTRDDKTRGLIITLRKIQGDPSPAP